MSAARRSTLFVVTLVVLVQLSEAITIGQRQEGDKMLGDELHLKRDGSKNCGSKNSGCTPQVESKILTGDGKTLITAIEMSEASCLEMEPYNGGPGQSFVVLRLDYNDSCGFDVTIRIYGM